MDKQPRSSPQQPLSVSLIQLIARPGDFDNEYVRVFGFYRNEFEGIAIYLHGEDYKQALSKNGLWVAYSSEEHNMKYVLIEGPFNAKHHGLPANPRLQPTSAARGSVGIQGAEQARSRLKRGPLDGWGRRQRARSRLI